MWVGRVPWFCHSSWVRINLCCGFCKRRIGVERKGKGSRQKGEYRGRKRRDYRAADNQKETRRAGKCLHCRKLAVIEYKPQWRPRGYARQPPAPTGRWTPACFARGGLVCSARLGADPTVPLCEVSGGTTASAPSRRAAGSSWDWVSTPAPWLGAPVQGTTSDLSCDPTSAAVFSRICSSEGKSLPSLP